MDGEPTENAVADAHGDGRQQPAKQHVVGESRWPMASAVVALVVMQLLLPHSLIQRPTWSVPVVEGILLIAVIVGDPGRIDRVSRRQHALTVVLIVSLLVNSLRATFQLTDQLVRGGSAANSAGILLAAGGLAWLANCIAFSLLYWELDSGGPAVRAHGLPEFPDFAFFQQQSPEFAPLDWRPQFVDYFFLGFNTGTTFGPADTLPLVWWAKLTMMLQSGVSLILIGLVVARAVGILR